MSRRPHMSAAASGPCASWRAQAVARHPPPHEASGWSSAVAGPPGGAMPLVVVRAASWLAGCGRHAARPSPTNASKRQRSLRPTSMSLLPSSVCQVLLEPAHFLVPGVDSMGRSRCEEPVPYRVGGGAASGGSLWRMGVGARRGYRRHSTRPLAMLPVLPRMDVSLLPLASGSWIPARSFRSGLSRPLFFAALWSLHAELLRSEIITAKQDRCGAAH